VNGQGTTPRLTAEDRELVDLLRAVLVDPNLHTDRRMRLHREISAVLRAVHRDLYGHSAGAAGEAEEQAPGGQAELLPDLLTAVLVDPNLYTDLRMRLHREIRAVLQSAQPAFESGE
jgi:hypothetical protein